MRVAVHNVSELLVAIQSGESAWITLVGDAPFRFDASIHIGTRATALFINQSLVLEAEPGKGKRAVLDGGASPDERPTRAHGGRERYGGATRYRPHGR